MNQDREEIFRSHRGEKGALIPVLQKVQEAEGYLSRQAISEIARFLKTTDTEIYGVATFYAQFRFTPPARHGVKVCLGTACHVRGGATIMERVEDHLKVRCGESTDDQRFGLERVACFGSCALAPVMVVDKDVYGRMTVTKAKEILEKYL